MNVEVDSVTSRGFKAGDHKSTYHLVQYVNICIAASSDSDCRSQPTQSPSKAASRSLVHTMCKERACRKRWSSKGHAEYYNYTMVSRQSIAHRKAGTCVASEQPWNRLEKQSHSCFDHVCPRPYALCQGWRRAFLL